MGIPSEKGWSRKRSHILAASRSAVEETSSSEKKTFFRAHPLSTPRPSMRRFTVMVPCPLRRQISSIRPEKTPCNRRPPRKASGTTRKFRTVRSPP